MRIGERDYHFASMEDALAFIEKNRNDLAQEAERQAEKAAKRIMRTGRRGKARKPYKPQLARIITAPPAETRLLNEEIRKIDRLFDNALAEILMAEAEIKDIIDIVHLL